MYQSDVQRFERSKNTDLFVTFFPLVLAFGLRGFLLKTAFRRRPLCGAGAAGGLSGRRVPAQPPLLFPSLPLYGGRAGRERLPRGVAHL